MSAIASLATYRDAAAAAFASGDYATARQQAGAALALVACMPNSASGGDSMQWDRPSILLFIAECRKAQAGAAGIRITKLKHVAEADAGDYS